MIRKEYRATCAICQKQSPPETSESMLYLWVIKHDWFSYENGIYVCCHMHYVKYYNMVRLLSGDKLNAYND